MKLIITIWFAFLLLLIVSCSRKGIDVKISNQSGSRVSKVSITTSEKLDSLSFRSIDDQQVISKRLFMGRNQTDGSYVLRYTLNGKERVLAHGYYTNGGPLNSSVSYIIKIDTVLIKFAPIYY